MNRMLTPNCALLFLLSLSLMLSCGSPGDPQTPAATPGEETSANPALAPADLEAFADLALACIDRPYPYKPHHVITSAEDLHLPREHHPVFYGCFDWHSAVHGHWTMVRVLKQNPSLALERKIRIALNARFTAEAFAAEAEYFKASGRVSFERPYGWAWTLRLAAELHSFEDAQARIWARNIAPLEEIIVQRYMEYLPKLTWPIRTGVHPNTAFAIAQAWDYAEITGHKELRELLETRARDYYFSDYACPLAYEPAGEDFFTPCLLEADLMRRVLTPDEFSAWLDGFLPTLVSGGLGPVSTPAIPSDPSDPKISHLDGLNLVRAWTLNGVLSALPEGDRRAIPLRAAATAHIETGLGNVLSGHYEGEHWLASFAMYLATDTGIKQEDAVQE